MYLEKCNGTRSSKSGSYQVRMAQRQTGKITNTCHSTCRHALSTASVLQLICCGCSSDQPCASGRCGCYTAQCFVVALLQAIVKSCGRNLQTSVMKSPAMTLMMMMLANEIMLEGLVYTNRYDEQHYEQTKGKCISNLVPIYDELLYKYSKSIFSSLQSSGVALNLRFQVLICFQCVRSINKYHFNCF